MKGSRIDFEAIFDASPLDGSRIQPDDGLLKIGNYAQVATLLAQLGNASGYPAKNEHAKKYLQKIGSDPKRVAGLLETLHTITTQCSMKFDGGLLKSERTSMVTMGRGLDTFMAVMTCCQIKELYSETDIKTEEMILRRIRMEKMARPEAPYLLEQSRREQLRSKAETGPGMKAGTNPLEGSQAAAGGGDGAARALTGNRILDGLESTASAASTPAASPTASPAASSSAALMASEAETVVGAVTLLEHTMDDIYDFDCNRCPCCKEEMTQDAVKCEGCISTLYCSTECQALHSGTHETTCCKPPTATIQQMLHMKLDGGGWNEIVKKMIVGGAVRSDGLGPCIKLCIAYGHHFDFTFNILEKDGATSVYEDVTLRIYVERYGGGQVFIHNVSKTAQLPFPDIPRKKYVLEVFQGPQHEGRGF